MEIKREIDDKVKWFNCLGANVGELVTWMTDAQTSLFAACLDENKTMDHVYVFSHPETIKRIMPIIVDCIVRLGFMDLDELYEASLEHALEVYDDE